MQPITSENFIITDLKTRGKTRDELLNIAESNRLKLDDYFLQNLSPQDYQKFQDCGSLPSNFDKNIVAFHEKLKKIEKKLDLNQQIKDFLTSSDKGARVGFDQHNFNIKKYADDELKELLNKNLIFQSTLWYNKLRSCLCCGGVISDNRSIDPSYTITDPSMIKNKPLKLRLTPDSDNLKREIQGMTDIEKYVDFDGKLYFALALEDMSIRYNLIYNPKKKSVEFNFTSFFSNDNRLYPEEFQIEMFKELINYCQIKDGSDKTKFQAYLEQCETNVSMIDPNIDLLKIISESSIKFSQNHVVNPKSLKIVSEMLRREDLSEEQRQTLLSSTPNNRNTTNFILQLNELLKENGYKEIALPAESLITLNGSQQDAPEYKILGMAFQCCLSLIYRFNDTSRLQNTVHMTIVSKVSESEKQDGNISDIPKQLSMKPTTPKSEQLTSNPVINCNSLNLI